MAVTARSGRETNDNDVAFDEPRKSALKPPVSVMPRRTSETSSTEVLGLISLAPPTSTTKPDPINPDNEIPVEGSPEVLEATGAPVADAIALLIPAGSDIDTSGKLIRTSAR